jgi:ATP synthase F1 complex assembly factor 1
MFNLKQMYRGQSAFMKMYQ